MEFFASVEAVYSDNELFQNCCVTSKLDMVDGKTLQLFPWLRGTQQKNQWAEPAQGSSGVDWSFSNTL